MLEHKGATADLFNLLVSDLTNENKKLKEDLEEKTDSVKNLTNEMDEHIVMIGDRDKLIATLKEAADKDEQSQKFVVLGDGDDQK